MDGVRENARRATCTRDWQLPSPLRSTSSRPLGAYSSMLSTIDGTRKYSGQRDSNIMYIMGRNWSTFSAIVPKPLNLHPSNYPRSFYALPRLKSQSKHFPKMWCRFLVICRWTFVKAAAKAAAAITHNSKRVNAKRFVSPTGKWVKRKRYHFQLWMPLSCYRIYAGN
jgi:hypothetical protein